MTSPRPAPPAEAPAVSKREREHEPTRRCWCNGSFHNGKPPAVPVVVAGGGGSAAGAFACPTTCDTDCEQACHESHAVAWKRDHDPEQCRAVIVAAARAQGAAAERDRWVQVITEHTTTLQRPGMGRNVREGVEVVLIRDLADLLAGDAP